MRKLFFFLSLLFGVVLSGLGTVSAADDPIACTMEYAPVCGSVQVQCIRAPCDPIRQTFSNSCMASAARATNVTQGACESTTGPIVGGDRDEHGCIPSAGYSWNAAFGKCLRPWETKNIILTIAPNRVACTIGGIPTNCLRVRIGGAREWTLWYPPIGNFTFEAGYTYRIRVQSSPIENPRTDSPNKEYVLAKLIQQKPLVGSSWAIESLNGKAITASGTISFKQTTIQAKVCNSIFGHYHLSGDSIKTEGFVSTMMYCEGDSMTLESAMDLSDAKWSIQGGKLTLINTKGDVTVWNIQ